MTISDWLLAACMALCYIGGLYALIRWADSYRRRQLNAVFDAIKARGVKYIVVDMERK